MRAGCRALPGSATQPRRPRPYRPLVTRGARAPRHPRAPAASPPKSPEPRSVPGHLPVPRSTSRSAPHASVEPQTGAHRRTNGQATAHRRSGRATAVESQLPRAGLEAPVPSGTRRPTGRKSSRTLLEGPPPEVLEDCPQAQDTASPADAAPRMESPPPTGRRCCEGHPSPRTPLLQLRAAPSCRCPPPPERQERHFCPRERPQAMMRSSPARPDVRQSQDDCPRLAPVKLGSHLGRRRMRAVSRSPYRQTCVSRPSARPRSPDGRGSIAARRRARPRP